MKRKQQTKLDPTSSGNYAVGDRVLAWDGQRIGTVVELNQHTVKVHLVGYRGFDWEPFAHNIGPDYLEAVEGDPEPIPAGSTIRFRTWRNDLRYGVVTEVDHAAMLVEYRDHNGYAHAEWIDRLRVRDSD